MTEQKTCYSCGEKKEKKDFLGQTYCPPCMAAYRQNRRLSPPPTRPAEADRLCLGPCGEVKPLASFYKKKEALDGYDSRCAGCRKLMRNSLARRRSASRRRRGPQISELWCSACGDVHPVAAFSKDAKTKSGYAHKCRGKVREYRAAHREKFLEATRAWRKKNPDKNNKAKRRWEKRNPERVLETQRRSYARHYEKNRESIIKKTVAYKKNKRDTDPCVRAFDAQRGRLRGLVTTLVQRGAAAEGGGEGRRLKPSTLETLGVASRAELTAYLESLFHPCPRTGRPMTWANYGGRGGWEIDHVRPIAAFDFTHCQTAGDLAAVLREAFHHTNLRPMWGGENRRKSSHYAGRLHRLRLPARLIENPENPENPPSIKPRKPAVHKARQDAESKTQGRRVTSPKLTQ